MGRPSKYTPETEKKICDLLRAGNTRKTAYTAAGISHETFGKWIHEFPAFSEAIKKAESEAEVRNVAIIQTAAKESWQAAAWWLERRRANDWKQRQEVDVKRIDDETLLRLLKETAEGGSGEEGSA